MAREPLAHGATVTPGNRAVEVVARAGFGVTTATDGAEIR